MLTILSRFDHVTKCRMLDYLRNRVETETMLALSPAPTKPLSES